MNKIEELLIRKQRDMLSIYFTAGYPELDDTGRVLQELLRSDADLIEVGFPFSDPLADGPVIQRSSETALENGMSLQVLFEQLGAISSVIGASPKPVILMGYLNPVLRYGFERFCADAAKMGVAGLILPDLPMREYLEHYQAIMDRHDLIFVPLITPQTSEERIRYIDAHSRGFLYLVSASGTTGTNNGVDAEKERGFQRIEALGLRHPFLVGFGIHNREAFQKACRYGAGAIIGTAFIQALSKNNNSADAVPKFIDSILNEISV